MIKISYLPMIIVSLSNANFMEHHLSKPDYTSSITDCQQTPNKASIDYNYLTTQELIETNIEKYNDILP